MAFPPSLSPFLSFSQIPNDEKDSLKDKKDSLTYMKLLWFRVSINFFSLKMKNGLTNLQILNDILLPLKAPISFLFLLLSYTKINATKRQFV